MKKAVIIAGGKQFVVEEGLTLEIPRLKDEKSPAYKALLIIEDDKVKVGTPEVDGAAVTAEVVEQEIKTDKVTSVRFKAKKRVHKVHGHRQIISVIKIKKITG